jgi:hypothetical protein
MRQLICGLAVVVVALGVGPAVAGTAETAFLNKLVGAWSGSGTIKGPDSSGIDCTLRFSPSAGGVAFSGQCLTDLGPPQSMRGAIAYNDKAKRYEATGKGKMSVGTKSGATVTFVLNLKDPMIGTGTATLKIGTSQIVTDTTVNRTGPQAGSYVAHVVLKK